MQKVEDLSPGGEQISKTFSLALQSSVATLDRVNKITQAVLKGSINIQYSESDSKFESETDQACSRETDFYSSEHDKKEGGSSSNSSSMRKVASEEQRDRAHTCHAQKCFNGVRRNNIEIGSGQKWSPKHIDPQYFWCTKPEKGSEIYVGSGGSNSRNARVSGILYIMVFLHCVGAERLYHPQHKLLCTPSVQGAYNLRLQDQGIKSGGKTASSSTGRSPLINKRKTDISCAKKIRTPVKSQKNYSTVNKAPRKTGKETIAEQKRKNRPSETGRILSQIIATD